MGRLIDADAFMKEIRKWLGNETDFRSLQEVIAGMPTIDHVKHGKWIYKPTSDHDGYIGCSNCDVHIPSCKIFQRNEYTNTSKYCPNCGARMDGE